VIKNYINFNWLAPFSSKRFILLQKIYFYETKTNIFVINYLYAKRWYCHLFCSFQTYLVTTTEMFVILASTIMEADYNLPLFEYFFDIFEN